MAIKVAVLGFAHGHVNAYCKQWNDKPDMGVSVVAGWDHDAGRLQQAVDAFGVRPFTKVQDLLAASGAEAVVVGSETSLHAELVEQAAAAGKAMIVQKPLALTLPEADRIVAAVAQHGVPFTMAWQMRVDPQNVQIKEMVEGGSL